MTLPAFPRRTAAFIAVLMATSVGAQTAPSADAPPDTIKLVHAKAGSDIIPAKKPIVSNKVKDFLFMNSPFQKLCN